MRLITTYLTMVLVGVALGRNIETNEAGKNDKAPLLSGVETLENLPVYYRSQMRQKFPDSKKASNTAEYLKPIEIAPKKENVIPTAADAKEQEMVKQPTLFAQLTQKVDIVKIKEPEIKENEKYKEPSKISQPQTANDNINAIPNLKETIMAPNNDANIKIDAEPKPVEVIREARGTPAISSPFKQSNANEKTNLKTEPQGHQEINLKENVKDESVKVEKSKSKDKVKKEAKFESSKTSEVKNNAEKYLDKKNSDDLHEKETKNNPKSTEEKGPLKFNEVDFEKNLAKIPKQTENLTKEKDSHKNKDKNYEKKRKEEHEDDDDDDSDDDDSSDGEDD